MIIGTKARPTQAARTRYGANSAAHSLNAVFSSSNCRIHIRFGGGVPTAQRFSPFLAMVGVFARLVSRMLQEDC